LFATIQRQQQNNRSRNLNN